MSKSYLTRKQVRERYNVADRTIARWVSDPSLAFPQPLVVNGRNFFAEDALVGWERNRAAPSNQKAA